jgi:hypothetical protein
MSDDELYRNVPVTRLADPRYTGTPDLIGVYRTPTPITPPPPPAPPSAASPSEQASAEDRALALVQRFGKEGRRFTIAELAKAVGVKRSQVYRWRAVIGLVNMYRTRNKPPSGFRTADGLEAVEDD